MRTERERERERERTHMNSFEKGVVITVLETNLDGWWMVRYQGKDGWAPATCLTALKVRDADINSAVLSAAVEASLPVDCR